MNAPDRLFHSTTPDPWWQTYGRYLPLLGLGALSLSFTFYILTQFSPAELETPFLPQVYLPLQVMTFLSLFFLGSFLTLNTRRGYLLAAFFQTLIFLRLQQISFSRELVIGLIGIFGIIELLLTILLFILSHANFRQKSQPHHRSRHSQSV